MTPYGKPCMSGGKTCASRTAVEVSADRPTITWLRQVRFNVASVALIASYEFGIDLLAQMHRVRIVLRPIG